MTAVLTNDSLRGQRPKAPHLSPAAQGTTSPRAMLDSQPKLAPPVGGTTPAPTTGPTTTTPPPSERATTSQQATDHAAPKLAPPAGTLLEQGRPATDGAQPIPRPLADPALALAADVVDDLERVRIAEENRLRSLTAHDGFGLDESHPDVARLAAIVGALAKVEHDAVLNLQRVMRKHPLGPWAKAQKGVGEKTIARLLAVLGGDPYLNLATGEPRTVSQLWSYCGHGDSTRRIRKGMTQDELFACGSPIAKKRVWLIATSCLKAGGPYADVYRARREQTAERTHAAACVRCGPSGKPAPEGSPWSAAHQHADALRVVGKELLRDLWLEARALHEGGTS